MSRVRYKRHHHPHQANDEDGGDDDSLLSLVSDDDGDGDGAPPLKRSRHGGVSTSQRNVGSEGGDEGGEGGDSKQRPTSEPAPFTVDDFTGEQQTAFELLRQGKNLMLHGPGGCGKSAFVHAVCDWNRQRPDGERLNIAITATTNEAAHNIGGETINRWCGIGAVSPRTPWSVILRRIFPPPPRRPRQQRRTPANALKKKGPPKPTFAEQRLETIRTTHLLFIDEVSMLSYAAFDALNMALQQIRGNHLPWGGIQVVLLGDFFQLSPVITPQERVAGCNKLFCFESSNWEACVPHVINLTESFRQSDPAFRKVLMEIRKGVVSDAGRRLLLRCSFRMMDQPPRSGDVIHLCPKRSFVAQGNQNELDALGRVPGKAYGRKIRVDFDADAALELGWTPEECQLYVDTLRKNFETRYEQPCLEEVLLKVGAPVTVQTTLYKVRLRWSDEDGETTVVKKGSHGRVLEFEPSTNFPVVRLSDGRIVVIEPYEWKEPDEHGGIVVASQIPLSLRWYMTTHLAQGKAFKEAVIDIGKHTFDYGQAYVALSRLTTEEGLYITHFDEAQIRANPRVLEWDRLERNKWGQRVRRRPAAYRRPEPMEGRTRFEEPREGRTRCAASIHHEVRPDGQRETSPSSSFSPSAPTTTSPTSTASRSPASLFSPSSLSPASLERRRALMSST